MEKHNDIIFPRRKLFILGKTNKVGLDKRIALYLSLDVKANSKHK